MPEPLEAEVAKRDGNLENIGGGQITTVNGSIVSDRVDLKGSISVTVTKAVFSPHSLGRLVENVPTCRS